MKAYWRSGGIAPRILDRGTRVDSFTPRPLYSKERDPGTHSVGGSVGPRAVLDAVVKRKIPSSSRESNPRIPTEQPVAQVTYHGSLGWVMVSQKILSWMAAFDKFNVPLNFFVNEILICSGHKDK
jgi:hypothetical protein